MPHAQLPHLEVVLNFGRQLQEPQVIGDRSPLLAHTQGHLLLSEPAFVYESLVTEGNFYRVQVFALDILHYRHLQHTLVVRIAHIGRNQIHPAQTAGSETPFSTDYLVLVGCLLADGDRLDETEGAYGFSEFLKCLLVERLARLERVRLYVVHRNHKHIGLVQRRCAFHNIHFVHISDRFAEVVHRTGLAEQGPKSLAQSSLGFV